MLLFPLRVSAGYVNVIGYNMSECAVRCGISEDAAVSISESESGCVRVYEAGLWDIILYGRFVFR